MAGSEYQDESSEQSKVRATNFVDTDPIEGSHSRSPTLKGEAGLVSPESCNFRDIGESCPHLRTGMVYRSSQVVSTQEVKALRLRSVLDLRVMKKPCRQAEELLNRAESKIKAVAHPHKEGETPKQQVFQSPLPFTNSPTCTKCQCCTERFGETHSTDTPVFHSDLMPLKTKLRVFGALPTTLKCRALREACKLRSPQELVAGAVVDPEVMGPKALYKIILDNSMSSVAKALRMFLRQENFPILIQCVHGKDRTGLIVMLLLLLCDCPAELVVDDFIQSELHLKNSREKGDLQEMDDFLTSDNVIASKRETMWETIQHIEEKHGGAAAYAKAAGLSDEEIAQIRTNLLLHENATDLLHAPPAH